MRQRDLNVYAYVVEIWTSDNEPNLLVVEKVRRDHMAGFRMCGSKRLWWAMAVLLLVIQPRVDSPLSFQSTRRPTKHYGKTARLA